MQFKVRGSVNYNTVYISYLLIILQQSGNIGQSISELTKTMLIPGNRIFPKAAVKVDGTESSYTSSQSPVSPDFPCDK